MSWPKTAIAAHLTEQTDRKDSLCTNNIWDHSKVMLKCKWFSSGISFRLRGKFLQCFTIGLFWNLNKILVPLKDKISLPLICSTLPGNLFCWSKWQFVWKQGFFLVLYFWHCSWRPVLMVAWQRPYFLFTLQFCEHFTQDICQCWLNLKKPRTFFLTRHNVRFKYIASLSWVAHTSLAYLLYIYACGT